LDNVARYYGIQLENKVQEKENVHIGFQNAHCVPNGALWFHHGYKSEWMKQW
jgi:hypothetical protein